MTKYLDISHGPNTISVLMTARFRASPRCGHEGGFVSTVDFGKECCMVDGGTKIENCKPKKRPPDNPLVNER